MHEADERHRGTPTRAPLRGERRTVLRVGRRVGPRPPAGRLADHLRTARDQAFVGRAGELTEFRAALSGDREFSVLFVHGAGGTGKTTLLHRLRAEAERAGRPVIRLDLFEPFDPGAVPPACVVFVDDFDRWQPMEPWLREEFLPALPAGSVAVLAGRTPPGTDWTADPGWRDVLRVLRLRDLTRAEAGTLLDHYGVPPRRRDLVDAVGGQNPLALRLAVEAVEAGRDDDEVRLDTARAVLRHVVGDLPTPAHRQALELAAYRDSVTEPALRAAVASSDPVELFRWLSSQPYADAGPRGVALSPSVRTAVRTELRWRNPGPTVTVRSLPRPEFDTAVRDALRSWRRPDLLAGNPLTASRMVADDERTEPVAALRAVLRTTLDTLAEDARQQKFHRALLATYLGGAPTQEAAAERLGLPFSTYRRHLTRGLDILISLLWRRETHGAEQP